MNAEHVIPFAVDLLLKSSALLITVWLVLQSWRCASAAQRAFAWCVAFILIALLPLTRVAAPHWALSFSKPATHIATAPIMETGAATTVLVSAKSAGPLPVQTWTMPDSTTLALSIWLTGILLLVAYRLVGAFLLHRCYKASSPLRGDESIQDIATGLGISRPIELRVSNACRVPMTWGTFRPVVMLPSEALQWPAEWLEAALRHEFGHVKNCDHLKRLVAFLTCAFYWPNPLVWIAAKQLQLAQEEASDNLVLHGGITPQDYAAQLIEVIRSTAGRGILSIPVVAMARPSTLEGRLAAILDETRNRENAGRRQILLGTVAALLISAGFGAVQLRAADAVVANDSAVTGPKQVLEAKLKSIILPKVDFNQTEIKDVIQFLTTESRDLSPDHKPISFVLRIDDDSTIERREVTLSLQNVSLGDVLEKVSQQTNLKYSVNDYVVYLRKPDEPNETFPPVSAHPAPAPTQTAELSLNADTTPESLEIRQKLKSITVSLVLKQATIEEAMNFLSIESQRLDTGHKGLRFIIGPEASTSAKPVTLEMTKASVGDALEKICQLADVKFLVLDHAIFIRAASVGPVLGSAPQPAENNAIAQPDNAAGQATQQKLKSIAIDKVSFDKVDIADALRFLTQKSKEFDPDKKGINFVLGDFTPTPQNHYHREVSVVLDNVPLDELLGYITRQTNLEYSVGEYVVYFRPAHADVHPLQDRTYLVPQGFMVMPFSGAKAFVPESSVPVDVKDGLIARGIDFPAGATATFVPKERKLVVHNTSEQLDLIEQLLDLSIKIVPGLQPKEPGEKPAPTSPPKNPQ